MTVHALTALPGLTDHVIQLGSRLSAADWVQPSGCPGWSVHDMFIHLACSFREVADRDSLPAPVAGSIERSNDAAVAAFRFRSPEQTMQDYRDLVEPAVAAFVQRQGGDDPDQPVDLDDAGVYPAHLMADSLVFDHYCHLRHDLPALDHVGLPVQEDEAVNRSSLEWLMAGLPQMSPGRLKDVLRAPVALDLLGPGGGTWLLTSTAEGVVAVEVNDGSHGAAGSIVSSIDEFLLWGTHRTDWQDAEVTFDGDVALAREVTSAIKVF